MEHPSAYDLLEESNRSQQRSQGGTFFGNATPTFVVKKSKTTQALLNYFNDELDDGTEEGATLEIDDIAMSTGQLDRHQAARLFYQVLVLVSSAHIKVEQAKPFGPILISKGREMQQQDD